MCKKDIDRDKQAQLILTAPDIDELKKVLNIKPSNKRKGNPGFKVIIFSDDNIEGDNND